MKHMYDVGTKPQEISSSSKSEKYYPSLSFTSEELPCLKGMDVGDKINLLMQCEISGLNKNNKDKTSYTLKIKKAGEESEERMSKALEKVTKEEV